MFLLGTLADEVAQLRADRSTHTGYLGECGRSRGTSRVDARRFAGKDAAEDGDRRAIGRVHAEERQTAGTERLRPSVGRIRGIVDDPEIHGFRRRKAEVDRLVDRIAAEREIFVDRVEIGTGLHLDDGVILAVIEIEVALVL